MSVTAATPQMIVAPYIYTANAPALAFTMNPFVVDPVICPVTYTCQVLAGSPRLDICSIIEGATKGTFDSITGNFVFESIDMANFPPGIYQLEITGTVGTKTDKIVVDIELKDPCPNAAISLLPSPISDDTYVLRDLAQPQTWLYNQIFTIDTLVDCGPVSVDFYNAADSSLLDVTLFDDTRGATALVNNQFSVLQTQDVTKAGLYLISYKAYHKNYAANFEEKASAFVITVINPCDAPVSVTPSIPVDQTYTITQNKFDYQVPVFTADPLWCEISY